MRFPALTDTIVAVSTGWQPAPLAVLRLSGSDSFALANQLLTTPAAPTDIACPRCIPARLHINHRTSIPALTYWFRAPRSYTGQNVVELHLPGCLPLLRIICDRLIAAGARRALPGEFTARALRNNKLTADQAMGVLQLMHSSHQDQLRQAARHARGHATRDLDELRTRLEALLAQVEAGIDFVEEEDVRFIDPATARHTLEQLDQQIQRLTAEQHTLPTTTRAHVALVGIPNAGKSTLFNSLLNYPRVLVSPIIGTTRDVISAELDLPDQPVILQDCPGLGLQRNALELATHLASERAADQADLILWVHPVDQPWHDHEINACRSIPPERLILIQTKTDLEPCPTPPASFPSISTARVSAQTGAGLDELRQLLRQKLAERSPAPLNHHHDWSAAHAALSRAIKLLAHADQQLDLPELLALELRETLHVLAPGPRTNIDETLLNHIYTNFCVGK